MNFLQKNSILERKHTFLHFFFTFLSKNLHVSKKSSTFTQNILNMAKDKIFFERIEGGSNPNTKYSIRYFFDLDGNPCDKSVYAKSSIVEYDELGQRITETYGLNAAFFS